MHWEKHEFELPKLPNNQTWKIIIDTSKENADSFIDRTLLVDDRSIVVLQSVEKNVGY